MQRISAHLKIAALESLMTPETIEEVFGISLGNSEEDYAERLERLERAYGGEDRLVSDVSECQGSL